MPKWTKEQQEAIDKEGCNIIVSAGAGSGKTAVLTERVIRKLKSGININQILVLTFTNAAAHEMKERIRSAIKKDASLQEQLNLIDGAYITTFDSFSLSMVKKYHYLLNISKDVSIVDASIIYNEKIKIIDAIMEEEYHEKDPDFIKLISDLCVKDDYDIKKYVLSLNDKMDLLMNKKDFLDSYMDHYFSDEFIDKLLLEYEEIIKKKFAKVKDRANDLLALAEGDFGEDLLNVVDHFNSCDNYETIYKSLSQKIPPLPRNSAEDLKQAKEDFTKAKEDLDSFMVEENLSKVKERVLATKEYCRVLVKMIKKLDARIMAFKYQNNAFEFNDIANMAISVVRYNESVRQELKYYFKEIMIDEYQDTSYLQESFIKLIANDDVYMVGDIKQSIYRFRHADPYIFKSKYDNYALNRGGYKIDLLKNFRSRTEVLNNINLIFDAVMDDEIGGARYQESHRMIFGNTAYSEEGHTSQNYDMEIYNYNLEKGFEYTKDEVEIFTILKDIKDKVSNHYQIFDKNSKTLRYVTYNDFCILIDRSTKFDLYKKIFEYFNVPLTKYTSTNIKTDDDIAIIKNILGLLICLKDGDYGVDFKYAFASIGRSYLFNYSDSELFDYLTEDKYRDSTLYAILKDLSNCLSSWSLAKTIEEIIDRFAFYMKSISVGDMEKVNVRLEYVINLAQGMEKMGFGIREFWDYLDNIMSSEQKLECEISENISDSVKIMTIHKSKGLEYHICYFAGFYSRFNLDDLKNRFLFAEKYGIIAPYYDEGIGDTFYKLMFKEDFLKEEISEKIRLFYVALTRCKEKMILVCNLKDEDNAFTSIVPQDIRSNYKSFSDIINSIKSVLNPYIVPVNLEELGLTHDYNLIKKTNYQDKIEVCEEQINDISLNIPRTYAISSHFSKGNSLLLEEETKKKMEFGTYIHYLFEVFDFQNPNFDGIPEKYQKYLDNFLHCGLSFAGNIYKEYEFIYEDADNLCHGIIDLMIEYPDRISIIDYKLKNIDDENYYKQLNGYRKFIQQKTKKEVDIYLYSIIDNNLQSLNNNLLEIS